MVGASVVEVFGVAQGFQIGLARPRIDAAVDRRGLPGAVAGREKILEHVKELAVGQGIGALCNRFGVNIQGVDPGAHAPFHNGQGRGLRRRRGGRRGGRGHRRGRGRGRRGLRRRCGDRCGGRDRFRGCRSGDSLPDDKSRNQEAFGQPGAAQHFCGQRKIERVAPGTCTDRRVIAAAAVHHHTGPARGVDGLFDIPGGVAKVGQRTQPPGPVENVLGLPPLAVQLDHRSEQVVAFAGFGKGSAEVVLSGPLGNPVGGRAHFPRAFAGREDILDPIDDIAAGAVWAFVDGADRELHRCCPFGHPTYQCWRGRLKACRRCCRAAHSREKELPAGSGRSDRPFLASSREKRLAGQESQNERGNQGKGKQMAAHGCSIGFLACKFLLF